MLNKGSKLLDALNGRGGMILVKEDIIVEKKDLANKIIEIQNCIDNKKPYEGVFFDDFHIVNPEVLYRNDKQFKNKYLIYLETFGVSADSEF